MNVRSAIGYRHVLRDVDFPRFFVYVLDNVHGIGRFLYIKVSYTFIYKPYTRICILKQTSYVCLCVRVKLKNS